MDELRQEIMLDDHLVKKEAFLDYKKKLIWSSGDIEIFPKGGPYEFSPKLKNYYLVCFWTNYA